MTKFDTKQKLWRHTFKMKKSKSSRPGNNPDFQLTIYTIWKIIKDEGAKKQFPIR